MAKLKTTLAKPVRSSFRVPKEPAPMKLSPASAGKIRAKANRILGSSSAAGAAY